MLDLQNKTMQVTVIRQSGAAQAFMIPIMPNPVGHRAYIPHLRQISKDPEVWVCRALAWNGLDGSSPPRIRIQDPFHDNNARWSYKGTGRCPEHAIMRCFMVIHQMMDPEYTLPEPLPEP